MLTVKNISIATFLAALAFAAPASASYDPDVYEAPKISGIAQVGKTLTASGGKAHNAWAFTVGYVWLRCTNDSIFSCTPLEEAKSTTYKLGEPEKGYRMRVAYVAHHGNRCDWLDRDDCAWLPSPATAAVAAAPAPTPTPAPTATPKPTVTPAPTPKPTVTPTPTHRRPRPIRPRLPAPTRRRSPPRSPSCSRRP